MPASTAKAARRSIPALLAAMRAQRYMHDYGVKPEQIAGVSVKNRKNGALNPDAQMRKEVTVSEVLGSRMIADPFTLLQCCPTGDGAAAIILASDHVARQFRSDPAQVVEIVRQLRGEAGPRQVDGAKVGLTHATGGGISGFDHGACSIHIFQR